MTNLNNNSFRTVGAGKTFLAPTDFIVQVDTSAGAVELVLPKIDTILGVYTTIQQFMGIRFVDISDNASTNNITITGFETDNINGATNVVLNTNGAGGILTLIGESDWSFTQNSTGGGAISCNYVVSITQSLLGTYTYEANTPVGASVLSYSWILNCNYPNTTSIVGATDEDTVTLSNNPNPYPVLLKLQVEFTDGCIATDYYTVIIVPL